MNELPFIVTEDWSDAQISQLIGFKLLQFVRRFVSSTPI